MTPTKGDTDYAVKLLSGVHSMCAYVYEQCMRVCTYMYVFINDQAALHRCYTKSPNTIHNNV